MLALSRYGLPKPWTPRRSDLCARRCSPPWAIGDADAAMDGQVDWLIAPDAFKGTLSAREVALALARGTRDGGGEIEICPVADGGEGTLEILLRALGGRRVQTRVHDPMGRPLDASFGWVQGQSRAIVSSADASGLARVAGGGRGAGRRSPPRKSGRTRDPRPGRWPAAGECRRPRDRYRVPGSPRAPPPS